MRLGSVDVIDFARAVAAPDTWRRIQTTDTPAGLSLARAFSTIGFVTDGAKRDYANRLLDDLSHWLLSLVAAPVVSIVGICIYAGSLHKAGVAGAGLVVAAAAWIAGGFLGFLFAIPKSSAVEALRERDPNSFSYLPNSNLVEISDWLTKILVGLGLVELGRLTVGTHKLLDFLAPELGGQQIGPAFGLAILVVFSVSGFLSMYLVTRLYVLAMFVRTEAALRKELEGLSGADPQTAAEDPSGGDPAPEGGQASISSA
jgi:hypothetical protein